MSYEGYTEYRCECGEITSADVYDSQPTACRCDKKFTHSREVDETNNPTFYGEWTPIRVASKTSLYTPWGDQPAPTAAAAPESFCDRVLGAPPKDIKAAIADEAKNIVSGARRSAYGKPEDNFERIARFWKAYFENTGRHIELTAADVSPMMRLMKEARLCETPDHRDSFVDLVGYTLTGAEINGVAA